MNSETPDKRLIVELRQNGEVWTATEAGTDLVGTSHHPAVAVQNYAELVAMSSGIGRDGRPIEEADSVTRPSPAPETEPTALPDGGK